MAQPESAGSSVVFRRIAANPALEQAQPRGCSESPTTYSTVGFPWNVLTVLRSPDSPESIFSEVFLSECPKSRRPTWPDPWFPLVPERTSRIRPASIRTSIPCQLSIQASTRRAGSGLAHLLCWKSNRGFSLARMVAALVWLPHMRPSDFFDCPPSRAPRRRGLGLARWEHRASCNGTSGALREAVDPRGQR